jgi:hypothetical protein
MKNHSLLYFGIFICSLVVGYTFSTRYYPSDFNLLSGSLRVVKAGTYKSIDTLSSGQRSLLLISTSSLNTQNPNLESIWLATYFPSDSNIRLLPIFPSGDQTISEFESQLIHSFNLKKVNGRPAVNQDFLAALEAENYWWSGYIVLDDVAMAEVFDLLGGIAMKGQILSGEQVLSDLPSAQDDPAEAYSYQITMLQSACNHLAQISANPDLSQLNLILPRHMLTDLEPEQLKEEFQSLLASDRQPACKFPLLEQSQILH